VGSGNGLKEAVSGETFHDLAQHAQIRFDAERHRAPIRSFLLTRAWFGAFPRSGAAAMCAMSSSAGISSCNDR
jgi:hypothetical protein